MKKSNGAAVEGLPLRARLTLSLTAAVVFTMALGGCATMKDPTPTVSTTPVGAKTAQEILDPMIGNVQEAVALAGGSWKYPNDKAWDATDKSVDDYGLEPCTANEQTGPQRFSLSIAGPALSDPAGATTKFAAAWRNRGHEVKQIGPTATDETKSIEMMVVLANGAAISFSANTTGSSIEASSECSARADVVKLANGDG